MKVYLLKYLKKNLLARLQWLMPVILATVEAEMRTVGQGQAGQTVHEAPSPK
jgi:hypothetical protein